eukprot:TRINITY_DN4386_c0_g1_i2.p2 TRINITY_DN4386_c0_g1~~TRINITY_DN4386_c0_g1_i2.p2  ORF type:complete len:256 (+),score=54.32 TRINITY_DN4386_c0_g1_i2:953-1720(+)
MLTSTKAQMMRACSRQLRHRTEGRRADLYAHAAVLKWTSEHDMTERSLRRAFHKVAKEVHPDIVGGDESVQKMREVNLSFSYLTAAIKRAGGALPVSVFQQGGETIECDIEGMAQGELCLRNVKEQLEAADTAEKMKTTLATLWEAVICRNIDDDGALLKAVVHKWHSVLPLGREHTLTVLAVIKKWSTLHDSEVSLDLIHDILEKYSDGFTNNSLEGSAMSECWPLIVEFLQKNCEPTEYTFLILRRMDPTIRI